MVDWQQYETVLLDMDGTLLDLAFDNYFWRELVPRCLARRHGIDQERARDDLFARYAEVHGSLEWYCLDYWTAELELDLRLLKAASSQRIRFLPGAREFLYWLSGSGKRIVLVTNAHQATLDVKTHVAGLERFFSEFITSHELGFPKEHAEFWPLLQERLAFDPGSTLFVDDNQAVLDTAADFGLQGVIAITGPDSRLDDNDVDTHLSVRRIVQLL